MKKTVKLFGIILLAVSLMTGCKDGKEQKNTAMGRYEEQNLELPADNNAILNIYPEEDGIAVYFVDDNEKFCRGVLKDGKWQTAPVDWVCNELEEKMVDIEHYTKGADGAEYLVTWEGSQAPPKLYQYQQGKVKEIVIEEWKQKDEAEEYFSYFVPDTLSVLEDGSILIGTTGGGFLYDKNGKRLWSVSLEGNTLVSVQNKIFGVDSGETEVQELDPETGEVIRKIKIEMGNRDISYFGGGSAVLLTGDREGRLYMLNPKGIHRLSEGGNMWETIVDGTLNSLSLPETGFLQFLVTAGGEFAVKCWSNSISETQYQFFRYQYNPDISSIPSKELSIYSLKETATIRKAVVGFQKKNPEVRINYRIAMEEQSGEKEDYIRALNTELLAGNGADMIVLDGLNFDSLVEKGVLSDLSDTIKPYLDNGRLFENMQKCYERDGKIYGIPSRFAVPVFFGDPAAVKAAASLETLAEYCKTEKIPVFGEKVITFSWLLDNYYPLCEENLRNEDGSFHREALVKFLEQIKQIAEQTKISKDPEEFSTITGILLLYGEAKLGREVLAGFTSTAIPFGIMGEVNGTYDGSKNRFLPVGILSINQVSQKKELAQQFLEYILSDEVQKADLADGFTVNPKLLPEVLKEKSESEMGGIHMTLGYDYKEEFKIFQAEWKPDAEEQKHFIDFCSGLDQPFACDEILLERVKDEAEKFYTGKETAQEAAQKIADSTKTYLAE